MTPPAASATWRTIVAEWPVLEDEWMLTVIGNGYRLAPDVLVAALMRHRTDPVRRARAALAGGTAQRVAGRPCARSRRRRSDGPLRRTS